jgi:PHP family Zn ribbon phosphoesterase
VQPRPYRYREIELSEEDKYTLKSKKDLELEDVEEPEPVEAIIIDKPIVVKIQKVQCPKCRRIFKIRDKKTDIKCPGCGASGKIKGL